MADIELAYIKAFIEVLKSLFNCTKGGGYFFL